MAVDIAGAVSDERAARLLGDPEFLDSFKATRMVMESMIEAIPQTALQIWIFFKQIVFGTLCSAGWLSPKV